MVDEHFLIEVRDLTSEYLMNLHKIRAKYEPTSDINLALYIDNIVNEIKKLIEKHIRVT